ncbi:MAG: hypothetical protein PHC88_14255 [Terrimicrobiaceae bacterium]|nr:hypothetical protein [Terrimicrobiaceae bacterium]
MIKASTHRLDSDVQEGLDRLSELLGTPKNKLFNEAVRSYVEQRSLQMEQELESTLKALRSYRKKDRRFAGAIADFVGAEAELGGREGLEGRLSGEPGPVQSAVLDLLHA